MTKVVYHGVCPADVYPLAKGFHPPEHLRSIAHLRARSNLISAVARVRSALAFATHQFFKDNGFLYGDGAVVAEVLIGAQCTHR